MANRQWEYHTVAIDPKIKDEELQKILNELGQHGWELVKVWDATVHRSIWVFKKEIPFDWMSIYLSTAKDQND